MKRFSRKPARLHSSKLILFGYLFGGSFFINNLFSLLFGNWLLFNLFSHFLGTFGLGLRSIGISSNQFSQFRNSLLGLFNFLIGRLIFGLPFRNDLCGLSISFFSFVPECLFFGLRE